MTESSHLQHIKIQGFKSIAELDLPMRSINILIGANGAGKTNFISLFTFLGQLSQGKLRNYIATEGGAERFFHFGTKHTDQIVIDLEVGNNGYHVEFAANLDDDSLVFSREYCRFSMSKRYFTLYSKQGESGFVSGERAESEPVKRYTREYLEQCRVYHFHDTSAQAKFKKNNKLSNEYYLEKDAANIAPFLYSLKTSATTEGQQSYRQIVAAVQTVAPFFHDFHLQPAGQEGDENIMLRWTHTKHDAPFSANVLSDGTARFICLATLLLQPVHHRPATIILDEPELGLHPAALDILAEIIQATTKETQVICSTQSITFANLFAQEDFIVVDAENGASTFRRLDQEPLEHWLEDFGMGDIWAKNLIGGRPAW